MNREKSISMMSRIGNRIGRCLKRVDRLRTERHPGVWHSGGLESDGFIDEYIGFVFIFTAQPRYFYFGNYNNSLR